MRSFTVHPSLERGTQKLSGRVPGTARNQERDSSWVVIRLETWDPTGSKTLNEPNNQLSPCEAYQPFVCCMFFLPRFVDMSRE